MEGLGLALMGIRVQSVARQQITGSRLLLMFALSLVLAHAAAAA